MSLDEDRILRNFLNVTWRRCARTTTRERRGASPPYLSFKFDPSEILVLPLPRPKFEIFVYSPHGGRAPAGRQGSRGAASGGPTAGGLPHRGPRPHEGSDGEERRDRARRREGWLRRQAAAQLKEAARRSRTRSSAATRPLSAACSTLRTTWRASVALPGGRGALRRGRSLPRRGGGQGHSDLLGHRQRHLGGLRFWLGDAFASEVRTATTTRRWGSRRRARGSR